MSTAEFLAALDPRPNARFVIETYTDMPKGTNKITSDPLSGQWSDLSKDAVLALVPKLTRRNETGAGARSANESVLRARWQPHARESVPSAALRFRTPHRSR